MNNWFSKHVAYRLVQKLRGEQVFKFYSEIEKYPYLTCEDVSRLQMEKLRNALQNAYENIPYYRKLFDNVNLKVNNLNLPADMSKIPVLSKQCLQSHYSELKNTSLHKRVSKEKTSGSSGNPLTVVKDRDKSAYTRAVMYRCYHQYGIDIGDRQARYWGVPVSAQNSLKEKVKDLLGNRIRLSAFDIQERSLEAFTKRIVKFKPKYFYGYPSVLHKYATWILENDIDLSPLKLLAVITTGEILYECQRIAIRKAFNCRVVNEYGSTEIGVLAFECRKGNLHINADHVYLETEDLYAGKDAGEVIVTELNNEYNPLIRYRLGDVASISNCKCDCGINFPLLGSLKGRDSTFIVTPEGRFINDAILEYVFSSGICQFRAVQDCVDALKIEIVRTPCLSDKMMDGYMKELVKHLGTSIKISYRFVNDIEPEPSGKLRYFISKFSEA